VCGTCSPAPGRRPEGPCLAMSSTFDVVTFGETMVLRAPAERGTLEYGSAYHASIGGESNSAVGLTRLGHSVCWFSRVGCDPFGSRILKTLLGEGIDVSRVETSDVASTGIMFKEPGSGNTTRIFYYRRQSAASTMRIEIAFDPNMRFRLWSSDEARSVFLEFARKNDVLIPSLVEAEILTGRKEEDSMLEELLKLGPAQVVVKAGDKGAWNADCAERGFCPCYSVPEIDPVGA
jgi:2-dehydro-3-deoxygluconokinase